MDNSPSKECVHIWGTPGMMGRCLKPGTSLDSCPWCELQRVYEVVNHWFGEERRLRSALTEIRSATFGSAWEAAIRAHKIASEALSAAPTQSETPADERTLRRLLALAYSGAANLYGDDGELQDSRLPMIDYVRDSVSEIERKITERGKRMLAARQSETKEPVRRCTCGKWTFEFSDATRIEDATSAHYPDKPCHRRESSPPSAADVLRAEPSMSAPEGSRSATGGGVLGPHEGTLQMDGVHCDDGDCWCWMPLPDPPEQSKAKGDST